MRPLIAMIMANLKMTVRNRGAIFWNLLFPAIFIVIFGMVFGGDQSLVINVGVTGDVSAYEQQVTSVFAESDSFELSDSNDRETLLADLEDDDLDAVVEFGPASDGSVPPVTVHYNQANGPNATIERPRASARAAVDPACRELRPGRLHGGDLLVDREDRHHH